MHAPVGELVQTPDMIEVAVGGHRDHRPPFGQRVHRWAERADPVRRVDDQVGLTAGHVPDVRDEQLIDVRFPQADDPVAGVLGLEPRMRDGQLRHDLSRKKRELAGGRRQCSLAIEAL